jgi:hypothetical protein
MEILTLGDAGRVGFVPAAVYVREIFVAGEMSDHHQNVIWSPALKELMSSTFVRV